MSRERVDGLRELMRHEGVQAYIIPSTDPHQSEYLPFCWQRRPFISSFTGSAGDVVVTEKEAGLWTDSRYFIQAGDQLDPEVFTLHRLGTPGVQTYEEWLKAKMQAGQKVGVDPRLMSQAGFKALSAALAERDVTLLPVDENLVDKIWTDRPPFPASPAVPLDQQFTGTGLEAKLSRLRQEMKEREAAAHVLTTLDSIAWLFNFRGSDVLFNPVTIAYAVVTPDEATLFIDPAKVTEELRSHFGGLVSVEPYDALEKGLEEIGRSGRKVWIDPATCNQWVVDRLGRDPNIFIQTSPVTLFKAVKNEAEIEGARKAHARDGAALIRFLIWLEEAVPSQEATEITVAEKLEELRGRSDLFRGPSFPTIAGYRGHGAIIHYEATPETSAAIEADGLLLVDSGGQYLDGTTDITRTIAMGEPTDEEKDRFTRVLQGLIRLSAQPFPAGAPGRRLDSLARLSLWEEGLDFGHGVGHGIGAYLNVHEGPQAISHARCTGIPLEPGMICSIEPGYYEEGRFGIRTENVAVVCERPDLSRDGAPFLGFETLTVCPIDVRLVKGALLSESELRWLNTYHEKVLRTVSTHLDQDEKAWLESRLEVTG